MFKVGDIVKCIKVYEGNTDTLGKTGRIVYTEGCDAVTVEFFHTICGGHTGWGRRGKIGHCWNFRARNCSIDDYFVPYNYKIEII